MTIRVDNPPRETRSLDVDSINDKTTLRQFILTQWINEDPAKKYRYFVETLSTGKRIYLERPGRLNKGCDFVIYIEDNSMYNNGNDCPPGHNFILEDLRVKKQKLSCIEWRVLLTSIEAIYNCEPFLQAYQHCAQLSIIGASYELILKTLRWMFIEQDVTYWANTGRTMLYNKITAL